MKSQKVKDYILTRIKDNCPYYPRAIFNGIEIEVYQQSFGRMDVMISNSYYTRSFHITNRNVYDKCRDMAWLFVKEAYNTFLSDFYRRHAKEIADETEI